MIESFRAETAFKQIFGRQAHANVKMPLKAKHLQR
jgi:hypothetical protein